ncbi:hypothetical protein DSECCO2_278010 [anaerobic digester metagenome]
MIANVLQKINPSKKLFFLRYKLMIIYKVGTMNIEIEFNEIFLDEQYHRNGNRCLLDPFRKKLIQITPEEVVRQKTAHYFIKHIGVPRRLIMTEQHLKHYNGSGNGRMDIVFDKEFDGILQVVGVIECKASNIPLTAQTFQQVVKYADNIGAEYAFITNGIEIKGWRNNTDVGTYELLKTIPTYVEMLNNQYEILGDDEIKFERFDFGELQDIDYLKRTTDCIGEDMSDDKIPSIFNLSECLLDTTHVFPLEDYHDFKVVKDIGIRYLGYGDASGSDFGTGYYRTLLIEDEKQNHQMIGFCVSCVGRTVGDPKYGNRKGKNVLIVSLDNFEKDSMIVQIDFNQFMYILGTKTILGHNGCVMMKSASSLELKQLIFERYPYLIRDNMVHLGELVNSELLYMDTPCVVDFIVNLIRYTFIRDNYKKIVSLRNKKIASHNLAESLFN